MTTTMTVTIPANFAELLKMATSLYKEDSTFENWQMFRDLILNHQTELAAIIGKETIPTLKRYTYRSGSKKETVSSVLSSISQTIVLSDSFQYSPFEETYQEALKRKTIAYTEADFLARKAVIKEKKNEREKALNNPETLEEFRRFISAKGESAMTDEQRIKYDELTADTRREAKQREEQRKAEVKAVENVTAEMVIKQSHHAIKNIPLWVVQLSTRVERETYNELNNRAKKLGGYYSSYTKNGAIPGFTFDNEAAATLFTQVKEGNVDASEIKEIKAEEKQQSRSEALKEKGQKIIDEATEELNRPRQENTHRRATMAENAYNRAEAQILFGKTLVKIAEAIETGEIKYLDKISNAKDLEELQNLLSYSKTRHIQAESLSRNNYETTALTAKYAEMPHPVVYAQNSGSIERMLNSTGKKQAAARMLKRLKGVDKIVIDTPQRVEDFATLYTKRCSVISEWEVTRWKESLMHVKRLNRMGIDTIEELRAALRELIELKKGNTISENQKQKLKIKEIERQFICAKIEGFFPTPENLALSIVQLANVQHNETILEPSAGLGHLAEAIKELHPANELQCIEYNSRLAEALTLKGFNAIHGDFLEENLPQYDKIIMNPPFENLQDVTHVQRAFKLLKSGGRLVAIMANNKHRRPDFLEMVDNYGYMQENEPNSFASAYRPTGVSTITVVLDKP